MKNYTLTVLRQPAKKSESVMVIGASTLAKPVIKEEGSIKDVSVSA